MREGGEPVLRADCTVYNKQVSATDNPTTSRSTLNVRAGYIRWIFNDRDVLDGWCALASRKYGIMSTQRPLSNVMLLLLVSLDMMGEKVG